MNRVQIASVTEMVATCDPASGRHDAFPYIDIASVDRESKRIVRAELIDPASAPSRARQIVQAGDVLVSTVRPNLNAVALVEAYYDQAIASTGFTVLRPSKGCIESTYLFHWVRSPGFITDMVRKATGASYPAVSDAIVKGSTIPLPPLEEQKRIAAILDKADAIRRKREQAIELANEFLRSLFLDMFGDPVTNPKGWLQRPLGECVSMENGSTPSKDVTAYWGGLIPWVTPKDMKIDEIADSIDHISQRAVEEQRAKIVPVDSVLIVVRGMILAHTVPIARNLAPCTINQDMKALRPSKLLDPVFLASALRCLHNTLLSKVTTSTHGTKKLDSEVLRDLIIHVPDLGLQSRFRQASDRACEFRNMALESSQATELLRSSLSSRAFRSEL